MINLQGNFLFHLITIITGRRCELYTCKENPCLNGGSCLVEGEGHLCLCTPGFVGQCRPIQEKVNVNHSYKYTYVVCRISMRETQLSSPWLLQRRSMHGRGLRSGMPVSSGILRVPVRADVGSLSADPVSQWRQMHSAGQRRSLSMSRALCRLPVRNIHRSMSGEPLSTRRLLRPSRVDVHVPL
jgi:hypothetical protein